MIEKLYKEGLKLDSSPACTKMTRLGTKRANVNRPILIQFVEDSSKDLVFRNVKNLKGTIFIKVGIKNDLTKKERQKEKELWEEVKRRNENSGEEKYKIRGPPWARKITKA